MPILEIVIWPVAVVIIVLVITWMFRAPITNLIGRIQRAAIRNSSVDFGDPSSKAVKQQETAEITGTGPSAVPSPTPHDPPPPNEIHAPIEHEIYDAIEATNATPDVERAWLVRAVAALRVQVAHERAYRLILGSQLSLLLQANSNAPPDMNGAQSIYDDARINFPELLAHFTFDNWLRFPTDLGFLRLDQTGAPLQTIRITPLGRDFLNYLLYSGLTSPKAG